jgi:hypothetical protein
MVAYIYNPSYLESEYWRTVVQCQSKQKVNGTPSQSMSQVWWPSSEVSTTREAIDRRIMVYVGSGKNIKPYLKDNLKAKRIISSHRALT